MRCCWTTAALQLTLVVIGCSQRSDAAQYLGKFLGKLTELNHGVSGEVYAVDARTLHIKDFTYDGQGPAAYFFAGNTRAPSNQGGFRIRDENGSGDVLRRYRKEGVTITLPEGKSLNNIKWFSVWCEEFEVNFGDVKIPKNFDYPKPQKIDGLRGVHGVSSDNIVIVDAQTLLIPNLSYDGEAPDAKFWVGRGPKPSPQGIRVPDENGKEVPLRRYDRKTVVLTLPGDLTVFDIGHFGIWCEAFTVDFGHVQVPQGANVPPSLKMLGVSPQSKLNCEVLHDDLAFEVRWAVAGDSIVLQLVAKLENREYMSFGISGDNENSVMIGGDVVVAWVDKETLKGFAEDYFLDAKAQCSGPQGSCPDNKLAENTNNIRLLNAAMVNGYSIVTYQRPLRPSDEFDKQIYTNKSQPVIWAIGPLNQRDEVSFHSLYNKRNKIIDFGRPAKWNCPMPEGDQPSMKPATARPSQDSYLPVTEEYDAEPEPVRTRTRTNERRRGSSGNRQQELRDSEKSATRTRTTERRGGNGNGGRGRPVPTPAPVKNRVKAWDIPPIECDEPDDGVFYAQLGPTGGKRGYPAITGHVGWGICWYINGLLIPVVNVVRGRTYTFVVEGGLDPEIPAKFHPFYITDDPIGGYEHKTDEEKKAVTIFAGKNASGTGRLCNWLHRGDSDADDFDSFGAYQRTLELVCDSGEPGLITWTPDKNTPDTVYYQCYTHRYLGWKINVLDSCDQSTAGSEIHEEIAAPEEDMESEASIIVETKIKAPNGLPEFDKEIGIAAKNDNFTYQELPRISADFNFKTLEDAQNATAKIVPVMTLPKIVLRRPMMPMRPPFVHLHPHMMAKKPFYRPMLKPMRQKPLLMALPPRQNVVVMKPRIRNKPSVVLLPVEIAQKLPKEPQVEISAQQASTEREPILLVAESKPEKHYEAYAMKPARNTGFNPASVVVEGGFKPIISKEIERRVSEDEVHPEVEIESETGVIDETRAEDTNSTMQKATEYFEPMFIPSPTINDEIKKSQHKRSKPKKGPVRFYVKRPRSEPAYDEVPAANERIESYYLPPDNNKAKPIERARHRSNIDVPPGTVVTYDGRKVSGASLTARSGDQRATLDTRSSKATELLKARPQYVQYRGELPPLDAQTLNAKIANNPSLQTKSLSRDLDTPDLPSSTKLRPLERSKREAHHNEEHTAQQERERAENMKDRSSGSRVQISLAAVLIATLCMYNLM